MLSLEVWREADCYLQQKRKQRIACDMGSKCIVLWLYYLRELLCWLIIRK
jgi:hypothetical protein